MNECERVDPHDHDDPRLPAYFHEWLRGERRHAPAMDSWQASRPLAFPSGSSAGLGARDVDDVDRDSSQRRRGRRWPKRAVA